MAFDFPSNPLPDDVFTDTASGATYVWKDYAWTRKPTSGGDAGTPPAGGVPEAPIDTKQYGRQDAAWTEVAAAAAGGDFLPLTGGTVTGALNVVEGPVTLSKTSAGPGWDSFGASLVLNRTDPAQSVSLIAQNAGVESWKVVLSSGEISGMPGYGDQIQFVRNNGIKVNIDAGGNVEISGNLRVYGTVTDGPMADAMAADPNLPGKSLGELLLQALKRIDALEAKLK